MLAALVSGQLWLFLIAIVYLIATHKIVSRKYSPSGALDCLDGLKIKSREIPRSGAQMAQSFISYKGCVVEIYSHGKARIMKPSGEDLGKEYLNYKEATKEIDVVASGIEAFLFIHEVDFRLSRAYLRVDFHHPYQLL